MGSLPRRGIPKLLNLKPYKKGRRNLSSLNPNVKRQKKSIIPIPVCECERRKPSEESHRLQDPSAQPWPRSFCLFLHMRACARQNSVISFGVSEYVIPKYELPKDAGDVVRL